MAAPSGYFRSRRPSAFSWTLDQQRSAHVRPGDHAALDDELGLRAEVLRLPHDQVGEAAHRDLSNEVRHPVGDGAGVSDSGLQ